MRWVWFFCLSIITALLLFMFQPHLPQKSIPLRIAVNPWPGYGLLHLAKDMGYFKKAGIDVELVEISDLYGVSRVFERGKVHAMTSTLVEVADIYKRTGGVAVPVILTDYSEGADVILTNHKQLSSIMDIEGKTVAVEPASLGYYLLTRALETSGLEEKDINISVMPQSAMFDALKSNKVDAVVSYPPVSSRIMQKIRGTKVIFDSSMVPGEILDAVSIDKTYLEKHPDLANRLLKVWEMAFHYYKNNKSDSILKLTHYLNMNTESLMGDLSYIHLIGGEEQKNMFAKKSHLVVLNEIVKQMNANTNFDPELFNVYRYVKQ